MKDKVNFKIYGVATWLTNNCNIHTLPNISQSKGNQTTKFGQLIEYNKKNILLKYHAENGAGRLIPDIFLFFKKAYMM